MVENRAQNCGELTVSCHARWWRHVEVGNRGAAKIRLRAEAQIISWGLPPQPQPSFVPPVDVHMAPKSLS